MCRGCALVKAGIIGRVDRFKLHNGGKCEMTKGVDNGFTAWMCEGTFSKRGCLTGFNNEIESSTYQTYWKCENCNKYLCLKCCLASVLSPQEKQKLIAQEENNKNQSEQNPKEDLEEEKTSRNIVIDANIGG